MVDENALINAWDRFRRGDRTAFSRRLYTAQGQKTFEDVRLRYSEDTDFRLTVDRYLQEFERLLGEVSRDDRDGLHSDYAAHRSSPHWQPTNSRLSSQTSYSAPAVRNCH